MPQALLSRTSFWHADGTTNAGRASADELRGATSVPINMKHRTGHAYLRAYGAGEDEAEEEGADVFSSLTHLSLLGTGSSHFTTRSQSLALPANLVIEPGARSASNRHSFKRYEIGAPTHRPQTTDQAALAHQRKPGSLAPGPRLTNQDLEPSLASSWGTGKGLGPYGAVESPRIKAGLA